MKKEDILRRICGLLLGLLLTPFVLMHAATIPDPVNGVLTITVTAQRDLYNNYPAADITATGATKLKIVGPLDNYYDFNRLRDVIDETLTQVDLSEAVITEIASGAFRDETTLTAVTLPDDLPAISSSAFYGCTSLAAVNLPSTLTSIGDYAFYNCPSLPATLTINVSGALYMGQKVFGSCTSLTAITINAGGDVTFSTSDAPFYGCSALQTIELHTPGKLTANRSQTFYPDKDGGVLTTVTLDARGEGSSMGTQAFYNCKQLTTVTLPTSLTTIGSMFFYNCSSLTSVTIPPTVTTIGGSAFSGCTSLAAIALPDGLTSIESSAFSNCSSLQSLDLSHTQLTEIPSSTCSQCTSLTSLQLPATVTTIGGSAFYGCSVLPSVTINVTGALSIGNGAFSHCSLLAAITIHAGGDVTLGNYNQPFESCPALQTFELHTPGKLTATCGHLFDGKTALTTVTLDAQGEGSAMGEYAFDDCHSLTTVTLPASLTTISAMFFYHCEQLASVTVPPTVTTIGNSAFSGCQGLESLDLSATQLTTIGTSAFNGCIALESMDLSATPLTTIGQGAFYGCTSLASVLLPAGITSMDNSVFSGCSSLQSLDLSQALITEIPNSTCYQCTSLATVLLPANITSIGSSAFYNCRLITSFSCTSNGALTIERDAFYDCRQMTDITLTAGGEVSLKQSAFYNCKALRNVTINAGGDVTLGTSSGSAFSYCEAIEDFELHTPGKVELRGNMFYVGSNNSALRRVWLDARGAGSTIGNYAFHDCHLLETLLLPAGLTSVGRGAFDDCNSLTAIELPATTTIPDGYNLFYNCSSLQSIDLSQLQITAIGNYAFYGCSALTTVLLPDGFTTIGEGMFYGCSQLTDIELPATVTTIGQKAFYNCSSLPAITVPASVTTMGNEVFHNCTSLATVSVLADLATLPERTFEGCSSLQTVTMDVSGITTIGQYAFNGCVLLDDIALPRGLTTLGAYAFSNCQSLSMITLPATLTTLNNGVFDGCINLISLEIPEGVSELPQSVFSNCLNMQSLYLPSTITTIHYSAWYGLNSLIDLHIQATTPPVLTSSYSRAGLVSLFVPEASVSAYQTADYWKEFGQIYTELTNLATLDDEDYNLLQDLFRITNGDSWKRRWTFGDTKADTPMLEGVKVSDGHVVQIALVDNNLSGELPTELMQFPNAWYINVSRNSFSGDIGNYFDNMPINSAITHLDLSDNRLTGNIGMMGNMDSESIPTEKLPSLTSFKIAHNHIRDVKPVLPSHIKTLDISGQKVDVNQTYNFSTFMDTNSENLPNLFPSILTYNHSSHNYGNVHFLLWAPDADEPWTVYVQKNGTYIYPGTYNYSASGWNFLPSGEEIYLSNNTTNVDDRIRINLKFNYQMGDITYNDEVDVSDLQTLINFAIQPETFPRYSPFTGAAANLIPADPGDPEVINVQDVVAEVNLLLKDDYEPSLARRSGLTTESSPKGEASDAPATLIVEDGQLVLNSGEPVAALDLTVSGGVAWSSELSLFSRKSRGERTIFYSMMGDVLPAGRTVLGAASGSGTVTAAKLASPEGTLIPVSIGDGAATAVSSVCYDSMAKKETHDLQGRRVSGNLKKGVYIVNGKKVIR